MTTTGRDAAEADGLPADPTVEAGLLGRLDVLAAAEARGFAERVEVLVELAAVSALLHRTDGIERYPELDVAGTLRIGQVAAGLRIGEALRLHTVLTCTLAGLRSGRVLVPQALVLLRETRSCSEQVAADAERRVFSGLGPDGLAPWFAGDLTRRVKRAVLQAEAALEPQSTTQREAEARAGRRVSVRPEPDGMGSLWALLPAEQLRAFTVGLDELTRRQQQTDRAAGLDRTTDQRRADLLAMLPALALHALDGTTPSPDGAHPAVVVNVHLPMATALGLSDAPGLLEGYGPLSAGRCRLLLPTARLRRVLVDQTTGEVLHVASRTSPPAAHSPAGKSASRRRPTPVPDPQHRQELTGQAPAAQATQATQAAQVEAAQVQATQLETGATQAPGVTASDDGGWLDVVPQPRQRVGAPAGEEPDNVGAGLPDGPLRRALLALVPDRPVLIDDTPEPQYRPSDPLARLVRTRDPHCTGLGCTRPSHTSELDHRRRWPLGPTSASNLAPLSKRCHDAKTRSWGLRRHPDGSSTWTSPTGRRYRKPSPWDPPPDPAEHQPTAPPEEPDLRRWRLPDLQVDLTQQLDQAGVPRQGGAPLDEAAAGHGAAPRDEPRLAALLRDDPPPF